MKVLKALVMVLGAIILGIGMTAAGGRTSRADLEPGLVGEYYQPAPPVDRFWQPSVDERPAYVSVDGPINFPAPDKFGPLATGDHFVVRWTGQLDASRDGAYSFGLESDDGARLTIDGTPVVVNGGVHGMTKQTGRMTLRKGLHDILIEYYENQGSCGCIFRWTPPGGAEEVVPAKALVHRKGAEKIPTAPRREPEPATPNVPAAYRSDRFHWLTFGCEGDHPKSVSFMGGAIMPGRTEPPIFYTVEVDGREYGPDEAATDRRQKIKWSLAEGYLPSPVSEWQAGPVAVRIQHFPARTRDSAATVVFSRVTLTASAAAKAVLRVTAGPERHVPLAGGPSNGSSYAVSLAAGKPANVDFVTAATGGPTREQIRSAGGFDASYAAFVEGCRKRLEKMAQPVALPEPRLAEMYKALQLATRTSIVKMANGDTELRTSNGPGTRAIYSYDQPVSHDSLNMVEQLVLEGDFDLARRILGSRFFILFGERPDPDYLDAIAKFALPYAAYLHFSGDKAFFTPEIRKELKANAQRIHERRQKQLDPKLKASGLYGLMDTSTTFDNAGAHLLVDNLAALHGLAAHEYLWRKLGEGAAAAAARKEMEDLAECVNASLEHAMKRRNMDCYNAFIEDADNPVKEHPGNWISTSTMMAAFPWGATLRGFDIRGTWEEHFDATVARALKYSLDKGVPEHSWGAWWKCTYGSIYNAGQGLGCLYSDRYRTEVAANLLWLLDNQTAPYQWGESFYAPRVPGDWTKPEADYGGWGLCFSRQALLQLCLSVKADGTVILGRGVPPEWLQAGSVIEWANVPIGAGKALGYRIESSEQQVTVRLSGDKPEGTVLIDLPGLAGAIASVKIDDKEATSFDDAKGQVSVRPGSKVVRITRR